MVSTVSRAANPDEQTRADRVLAAIVSHRERSSAKCWGNAMSRAQLWFAAPAVSIRRSRAANGYRVFQMATAAQSVECTRSAGCTCPLCDMSAAAMGVDSPAAASVECTRSMGCTCPQCDMSAAALGDVTNQGGKSAVGGGADVCPSAGPAPAYTFAALNYNASRTPGDVYDVEKDGKLGSVYTMLTEVLAARGDWKRAKAERKTIEAEAEGGKKTDELKLPRSFQLLLGTAQGKGIKFGQLGYGMWPPPLVNYYRGFNCICRKALLIQTLREAAGSAQEEHDLLAMMPETFLFYPAHADDAELNEHDQLAGAFAARAEQLTAAGTAAGLNLWILKPSDGAKGERIELMSDIAQIQGFLKTQTESEATSGWVVQRYIDRPLLLRGDRKFDVRCWVLLDPDYNVFLYREGVLRTGAVAYSVNAENLDDKFIHLTNHCIAAKHPDFGALSYRKHKCSAISVHDTLVETVLCSDSKLSIVYRYIVSNRQV